MDTNELPVRPEAEKPPTYESRWQLLRDMLVFQLKLFIDGLRDVILLPISLVAGVGGLLLQRDDPGRWFNKVLVWGRQSEAWINLFGRRRFAGRGKGNLDKLVAQVESRVVEQYQRGGVTAQAKQVIDKTLDALNESLQDSVSTSDGHAEKSDRQKQPDAD